MLLVKPNRLPNSSPAKKKYAVEADHLMWTLPTEWQLFQHLPLGTIGVSQLIPVQFNIGREPTGYGFGLDPGAGNSHQTQLIVLFKNSQYVTPPPDSFKRHIFVNEQNERILCLSGEFIVHGTDPSSSISVIRNQPLMGDTDSGLDRRFQPLQLIGTNGTNHQGDHESQGRLNHSISYFHAPPMNRKSLLNNLFEGARSVASRWFKNPYASIGLSAWQIKILKHLPEGKLRSWRIAGHQLWFTSPAELMHGLKEIFAEKIYFQRLPENAYILDCGANIGLSVIYLKKLCPTARIKAFEPDPANFELLQKNIRSYGLKDVEVVQAAIWRAETTLHFQSAGSMGSSIDPNASADGIAVEAVRLKEQINQSVDFLKIDIEGAEYEVIRDVADKLKHVKQLFLEYHGRYDQNNELLEILEIVRQAGFQFYMREAAPVHPFPFKAERIGELPYDVQLNIFCTRAGSFSN